MANDNPLQLAWGDRLVDNVVAGRMSRRDLLRKATVFGLSTTAIGTLLVACGGDDDGTSSAGESGGGEPTRGGTLRMGVPTPPTATEPVTMYDASSIAIVQLVAEYLAWLENDFSLSPRLAESWAPEDGGQVWTFQLRSGVTFSDGRPVDAAVVAASFDRLLDPANESAALSAFDSVLSEGGVAADGDSAVVFTLDRAFSDFPYLVSAGNYNTLILPDDYAMDFQDNPIGTGAFVMTEYDADRGATFERNEDYWQDGQPYLDGVEVTFYEDGQANTLGLQSDEIDAQMTSQIASLAPIASDDGFTIDDVEGTGMVAFTMRVDQAPFDRVEVRQAIAWALDRSAVIETVSNGAGVPGNDHLLAPPYPASPTDLDQRDADADRVAELLAEAGVEDLAFTLTYDPPNQPYALVIQDQLSEVGIEVTLEEMPSDTFYGGDQETDTPWLFTTANLVGWAARAVPSQFIIPMAKTDGIWNGAKYSNPTLDEAADAYDAATGDDEKREQARIIAETMREDVPYILSYWSSAVRASSSRVRGLEAHPSSYLDLNQVSLEQ